MSYQIKLNDVVFTRYLERGKSACFPLHRIKRKVIDHLSLSIEPGERVGLLGQNGAGKTTLLRIMAGIFQPDSGSVSRVGDVSCFLDGFYGLDPFLTGRENAKSRSLMSGLSRTEIISNVDEIESFSDIGQYFDQPVKNYSTGMLLRLVFAIGTSQTHQILLIDEGLGTADINFQQKAFKKLEQMYASAPIIVIASHNLEILRNQCNRGIVMKDGHIVYDGNIETAISQYTNC
jgi:ABC-2 type transport system ATP-binding protein/lipopolysaccharide transport system ATP-binding protein